MNIYSHIIKQAETNPSKLLASFSEEKLQNKDFIRETEQISNALVSVGISPNDKVGIILPNSSLWYTLYWSVVKIGGIPVPLDPQVGEWEMKRLLSITEVKICFVAETYRSNKIVDQLKNIFGELLQLEEVVLCNSETEYEGIISLKDFLRRQTIENASYIHQATSSDALMLACTSGSTGNPKIITVPHEGFYKSQRDMGEYLSLGKDDVMLLGMPLYHQGGFGMGLQATLMGGTVLYQPMFDPVSFLETIEKCKVTAVQLTATLAKILLSVPNFEEFDISGLKLAYFAGEVLPMNIAEEFFKKRNIRVVNVIGSSETATMAVWDSLFDKAYDVNEFRPLAFTKLKIVNENLAEVEAGQIGTIFIHTDALIMNYYKNEQETNNKLIDLDGVSWFNTGDLGQKIADGRVRFTGRAKRIIKRGANLIYPEELESFLLTHPKIEAVAVVSEKHELLGEMVIAYIQPHKGEHITRGDVVKFCKGKLAAYKIPDQVEELEEIPHDIGKIQFKYLKK